MGKLPLKYRVKYFYSEMSQDEKRAFMRLMSDELGITPQMIYFIMNYRHGEGGNATAHQLQAFARYFNVTMEELLEPAPAGTTAA